MHPNTHTIFIYSCTQTKNKNSTDLKSFVDSLAQPLMSENNIPGLSIAITVNGKHSFFNYGVISKENKILVNNQYLFELGSISTHIGYFKTTDLVQDLIWEQYDYPVTLNQLLAGNSDDMVYKANPIKELTPPEKSRSDVLINKTGSTNGFASYIVCIPSKRIGIVILANKNYPIKPRVETAFKILSYLDAKIKNVK